MEFEAPNKYMCFRVKRIDERFGLVVYVYIFIYESERSTVFGEFKLLG